MNPEEKKESNQGLSIDRAALILLRVKRVFRKKKQQRNKEKQGGDPVHILNKSSSIKKKVPPPLLRSRTLPAIVVPGLSILQAQISDNRSTSTLDTTCDNNSNSMLQSDMPGIIYDSNCLDPRRHLVHHRLSSPEASAGMADAMLQLKISAPPRALSASGPACSSQTALYSRLARLLNQNQKSPVEAFHNATRRLSWERDEDPDELLNFPRSASIDSIVESRHCGVQLVRKLPSPLLNRGGSTTPPLSPAIARRLKGTRAITSLFAAVEHGHVDKTRTILESADVNVNSMNSDGFTPLDVAILSNNAPLVKLLISFGAQEGNKFTSPDKLGAHLRHLLHEAERRVLDLGGETSNSHHHSTLSINRGSISVPDSERSDKTLALWERRCKGLKKMLLGFDQARPPDSPSSVSVEVTGVSTVCVSYQEPDSSASPQCTKYKVEWSLDPEFQQVSGSCVILDSKQHSLEVSGLTHRQRVYFRAYTGNIRGFSPAKVSVPAFVEPSSWRDCSCVKTERISSDGLALLDRLFSEMKNERPDLKTYNEPVEDGGGDCAGKRKKTASIKQLFTAASKFQKHLKRGVFLSCLLYHEDKVLVTNEDFLPVIEIDDTYPNSIYQDFHWLLKVSCTWEDIKLLRNEMEKSLSNSNTSNHFRVKLLNASLQMQTALSIENIGQLYHRPIKDSEGTIVIPLINYVKNVKSISVLNSRWLPLSKLTKSKRTNMCTENNVSEMLMASVQDQITYHQVSRIKLSKGLYLGYLKMRSSVDLLQVLVPSKSPNVPPHCKIRDNPHVTADEWEVLRSCNSSDKLSGLSEQQRMFLEHVALTMKRLFRYMEVTEEDCALHRLYDSEVIEISPEVSLIMIVPPIESACSVPGQRELLLQRPDLLPLPVQVFEMVHLGTYQRSLVSKYSRLSCILQLDTALAQQGHREAFSNTEVSLAKERLSRLETLQSRLNTTWKQTRWLLDVLSYARDRMATQCSSVPSVKYLLSLCNAAAEANTASSCFLQPPDPKNVKSRGSWPGPGVGRLLGVCPAELSRSEQQLSAPPPLPPRPPVPLPIPSIELAGPTTTKLAPSRSDDVLIQHTQAPATSTTRTSSSATTSPLLPTRLGYINSTTPPTVNVSSSLQSLSSDDSLTPQLGEEEGGAALPTPTPGIIQVYAAYNTGLAPGTSLMLHVSPRTCAREVVNLVVKEVNMAVLVKGKAGPIYPTEELSNFCLVAVLGPRERCLRDDFKPLQLQNPWKKGRLYVRQKHDKLAALDQSSRHSTFL